MLLPTHRYSLIPQFNYPVTHSSLHVSVDTYISGCLLSGFIPIFMHLSYRHLLQELRLCPSTMQLPPFEQLYVSCLLFCTVLRKKPLKMNDKNLKLKIISNIQLIIEFHHDQSLIHSYLIMKIIDVIVIFNTS